MQSDADNNLDRTFEKDYTEVFNRIDLLLESGDLILIAIDGNCGSGKSTLSRELGKKYDCNIFHTDDYFLRPELRTPERLKEIGGNFDYDRFREEVISGLLSREKFQYRRYNCKSLSLEKPVTVTPKKMNIIEGAYSIHPTLIEYYDLKIFLYVSPGEQRERILKRNGEAMQRRFLEEWIPMEERYFKEMRIKEKCDLILRG